MQKEIPDICFSDRESLVLCPKCRGNCREVWLTKTISGRTRVSPKRLYVICKECNYDLASAKQPEQRLVIQKI